MLHVSRLGVFLLSCLFVFVVYAQASIQRETQSSALRRQLHHDLFSGTTDSTNLLHKRSGDKRCKSNSSSATLSSTSSEAEISASHSSGNPSGAQTSQSSSTQSSDPPGSSGSSASSVTSKSSGASTPTSAAETSSSSDSSDTSGSQQSSSSSNSSSSSGGVIKVSSKCGSDGPGATEDTTATTGPNGSIDWINCGIDGSGWQPPKVGVSDLITVDLSSSLSQGDSPYKACGDYIDMFEKYGNQYSIPPIMLAAFAMQESSCNPDETGGGGEQGLMQLTSDKCGDAPNGNCKDPAYNIEAGAKYFSDTLASNNGDVFLTIGQYNGWSKGMTIEKATAAASSSCCQCQNNLDYIFQWVNGWILGIDSYSHNPPLGKYFNLNTCS